MKPTSSVRLLSFLIQGCVSKLFSFSHLVLGSTQLSPGMGQSWLSPCVWSLQCQGHLCLTVLPLMSACAALWQVKAGLELPVCYVVSEQGSLAISLV